MAKAKPTTDDTDDTEDTRFAGLPAHQAETALAKPRAGRWFTIPAETLPASWNRQGQERVLITALTVGQEDQAAKLAGAGLNVQATFRAKVIASIYGIGQRVAVPYMEVKEWYEAIGPAARTLLDDAHNRVNAASESAAEMFRASEEPWVG